MISKNDVHLEFLLMPVAMAVFGYFLMKRLVFDLVDEVWDDGDALLIRNGKKGDRILLSNIINVSYSTSTNPPRVTLTLREPSAFGKEVAFSPPSRWLPFAKHPIISELIERIDEQRQNHQ